MIDIILLTCNRKELSKQTIDELYSRTCTPFRLIVVDNHSEDGTAELLKDYKARGLINELELLQIPIRISEAYNLGFRYIQSEYFLTMQDDIIVPKLEPDIIQQLIGLMKKYPKHGGIGCRIQRIPNINWNLGNEDLVPARKALSAYCRIQRKSDIAKVGFGTRLWDDLAFVTGIRERLGLEVSWAKNLWCNHLGHNAPNRGYNILPRTRARAEYQRYIEQPVYKYPEVDPDTNMPIEQ